MKSAKYHAALPYPVVSGLKPDKKQARILMEGYCGSKSELTTVTQYAYHHLNCLGNEEIAKTIHGIFLVETHHLELLGKCLIQLGEDPKYFVTSGGRQSFWQAGLVDYKKTMKEILLADIEGEKGAFDYYLKTAQIINNDKISPLLLRLAEDERLHYRMFVELNQKYFTH